MLHKNNTSQLLELMTFDANTSDIESRFEQIAKMLFESFAIQKGGTKYLFKEIEFYFYNKDHRDIITHPRVSEPLCWYVNDFGGIDLNFKSCIKREYKANSKGKSVMKYVLDDSAYFGGILIRQLIREDGSETLNGPLACSELFRCYDATGSSMNKYLPLLVECDNGKVTYTQGKRTNLLRAPQTEERVKKKVDNILYLYHECLDKNVLYKEFEKFIKIHYGYKR